MASGSDCGHIFLWDKVRTTGAFTNGETTNAPVWIGGGEGIRNNGMYRVLGFGRTFSLVHLYTR